MILETSSQDNKFAGFGMGRSFCFRNIPVETVNIIVPLRNVTSLVVVLFFFLMTMYVLRKRRRRRGAAVVPCIFINLYKNWGNYVRPWSGCPPACLPLWSRLYRLCSHTWDSADTWVGGWRGQSISRSLSHSLTPRWLNIGRRPCKTEFFLSLSLFNLDINGYGIDRDVFSHFLEMYTNICGNRDATREDTHTPTSF